jgi:hypothetical protein
MAATIPRLYVNADCFKHKEPIVVPVRTLLSQLP